MKELKFIVDDEKLDRIDKLIAVKYKDFTRSEIQNLIAKKLVLVNGKPIPKSFTPSKGDVIYISAPVEKNLELIPQDFKLDIVYEDKYLAVINKPKGMLVHPTHHQTTDTLVNALLYMYGEKLSKVGEYYRPGIVHRLDKDTSGLLIIAFDDNVHLALMKNLQQHKIKRSYQAVVHGVLTSGGTINMPIGRDPSVRVRMAVVSGGREAITHYSIIKNYDKFTHLGVILETGRTHQIRVHMAHIGHPIAGDTVYGASQSVIIKLNGQCLHAYSLKFSHPILKKDIVVESQLPDYFKSFLEEINH